MSQIHQNKQIYIPSGFCTLLSDDDNPVENQSEQGSKGGILHSQAQRTSPKKVCHLKVSSSILKDVYYVY